MQEAVFAFHFFFAVNLFHRRTYAYRWSRAYANSAFVRPYAEDFGYDLAVELKASGYIQTEEGVKDLTAVIVSGDRDKGGTDTIKIRKI